MATLFSRILKRTPTFRSFQHMIIKEHLAIASYIFQLDDVSGFSKLFFQFQGFEKAIWRVSGYKTRTTGWSVNISEGLLSVYIDRDLVVHDRLHDVYFRIFSTAVTSWGLLLSKSMPSKWDWFKWIEGRSTWLLEPFIFSITNGAQIAWT